MKTNLSLEEEIREAARLGIAVVDLRKRNLTNDDLDRMGANAPMCAPAPKSKRKKAELVEPDFHVEQPYTFVWTIPLHVSAGDNFGSKDRHRRIGRAGHERTACTREFAKRHAAWAFMFGHAATGAKVKITLARIGGRKMDFSNVVASMKYIQDCCAAWLGRDDSDPAIVWDYAQKPGGPCGVRVTIEKA